MIECGSCSPLPAPSLLPGCGSPPSLHDRAPIRAAAAIRLHAALDLTALGGQRGPCDHAALAVAAVVLTAAVSGHAAAGHALIRFQLILRRRCGRAECGLTGAIVPRDCEQLVAARAAQAGRLTVRQARPMTAARAYQIRIGSVVRSGHGPLAGRRAAELEQGAGHRDVASTHPKLHLPWRERHNRVPGAPPKPASGGRLQPGPLSDTHFLAFRASSVPLQARTRERCSALTRVSSDSQPNTGKWAGSNRPAS